MVWSGVLKIDSPDQWHQPNLVMGQKSKFLRLTQELETRRVGGVG